MIIIFSLFLCLTLAIDMGMSQVQAHRFEVEGSLKGVKAMLVLVWSREQGIREQVY